MTSHEVSEFLAPIRHQFADPRSLVLPALKFAQGDAGWLSPESMAAVAEATGFSEAYVESVATFYDRLYTEPVGCRVLSVCVTLSCMLRGSDDLFGHVANRLGLDGAGTTEDGMFTLQTAQCLGACDRAPCMQVDAGEQMGPLTCQDADRILDELRAEGPPARYER